MSLRSRFVALVVGAVAATLLALALPGRSVVLQEYEASIHAIVRESRVESAGPAPALTPASLETFAESVRTPRPGERAIWLDPVGRVVAASEPSLEGREGQQSPDGSVVFELRTPQGTQRLRLGGGRAVVGPNGADEGRVFRFPTGEGLIGEREAAFSRALDRRLWLWGSLILAGAAGLAVVLVSHTLAPLRRLGTAAGRIAAGDLTARAGAGGAPEIREVADAFDTMARHLEASEAERRRMIRDVAHDLRTPLTNLRGQIEALQDGLREPDGDALQSIHDETALLHRLVVDLESLARADENRLPLRLEAVELSAVVDAVVDGFVRSSRLARDSVTIDVRSGLLVRADRAALGRAVRNVVDNAAVHAPGAPLEIRSRESDDHVDLSIRDHGPGIDAAHLPRITERFYRVDDARSRGSGGSGLGLAIADELVRACGGHLTIDGPEEGGVEVVLTLARD